MEKNYLDKFQAETFFQFTFIRGFMNIFKQSILEYICKILWLPTHLIHNFLLLQVQHLTVNFLFSKWRTSAGVISFCIVLLVCWFFCNWKLENFPLNFSFVVCLQIYLLIHQISHNNDGIRFVIIWEIDDKINDLFHRQ